MVTGSVPIWHFPGSLTKTTSLKTLHLEFLCTVQLIGVVLIIFTHKYNINVTLIWLLWFKSHHMIQLSVFNFSLIEFFIWLPNTTRVCIVSLAIQPPPPPLVLRLIHSRVNYTYTTIISCQSIYIHNLSTTKHYAQEIPKEQSSVLFFTINNYFLHSIVFYHHYPSIAASFSTYYVLSTSASSVIYNY